MSERVKIQPNAHEGSCTKERRKWMKFIRRVKYNCSNAWKTCTKTCTEEIRGPSRTGGYESKYSRIARKKFAPKSAQKKAEKSKFEYIYRTKERHVAHELPIKGEIGETYDLKYSRIMARHLCITIAHHKFYVDGQGSLRNCTRTSSLWLHERPDQLK